MNNTNPFFLPQSGKQKRVEKEVTNLKKPFLFLFLIVSLKILLDAIKFNICAVYKMFVTKKKTKE
jgi:hypothetical protein